MAFDSTTIDTLITNLYRKNTLGNFVYRYYIKNIAGFSSYKSPEDFSRNFTVGNALYQEMVVFAARDSINISSLSLKDRQFLEKRLKSLLARQIWRTEGFYEVINEADRVPFRLEKSGHYYGKLAQARNFICFLFFQVLSRNVVREVSCLTRNLSDYRKILHLWSGNLKLRA